MTSNEKATQPSKVLPTDRVSTENFFGILRAYAIASNMGKGLAERGKVAEIVDLNASTITLANPFLADTGFISRTGKKFDVAEEVVSFARAHQWNSETAGQKLAPIVKASWFGELLLTRLAFDSLPLEESIQILADEANAEPKYRSRLETLLDFMVFAGLVSIENGTVSRTNGQPQEEKVEESDMGEKTERRRMRARTSFSQPVSSTDGVVQFHVSVKVDMDELATWQADRISALFSGIAQVLAAKEGVDNVEKTFDELE